MRSIPILSISSTRHSFLLTKFRSLSHDQPVSPRGNTLRPHTRCDRLSFSWPAQADSSTLLFMSQFAPIPDGYHTVTPYLMTDSVRDLLQFTQNAFDAKIVEKMELPDGGIMHAEIKIGDSIIMMGQAREGAPAMPAMLYLYVEDCDAAYQKAIDAGAISEREPEDQFYGDRSGGVKDPLGNQWWFGTRVENVSMEEAMKRMMKMNQ